MSLQQESLFDTAWDAVIFGTGLTQSLVAAALSKAGKKILHVDSNSYYGGAYASFSLEEVTEWANQVKREQDAAVKSGATETSTNSGFSDVKIEPVEERSTNLGSSRSYTLSLSPQILFGNSSLLPLLVRGDHHQSLEFLKVGNWFVYGTHRGNAAVEGSGLRSTDVFKRVPNSREDVFLDKSIDLRTKRALVKVLKNAVLAPGASSSSDEHDNETMVVSDTSLEGLLTSPPNSLPPNAMPMITALTMLYKPPSEIPAALGVKNLRRHLLSMGRLGPDFSAVLARYGTSTEVIQVLCRAAAVAGGAVYILAAALQDVTFGAQNPTLQTPSEEEETGVQITLADRDPIWTKTIIGHLSDISNDPKILSMFQPDAQSSNSTNHGKSDFSIRRAIYIVSSPLDFLFESKESSPSSGAVLYFPSGTIEGKEGKHNNCGVYVIAHSADTAQCPMGQTVLYTSTQINDRDNVDTILQTAALNILKVADSPNNDIVDILLSVYYTQTQQPSPRKLPEELEKYVLFTSNDPSQSMVLTDSVIEEAMEIYEKIVGTRSGFMDMVSDLQEDKPQSGELES